MQVFVVSHIDLEAEGIGHALIEQEVYLDRTNAEDHFLTLCKRGLQNEDDFSESDGVNLIAEGRYEDTFNLITLKEKTVI